MELLPDRQILFNRMRDTICGVYERFGFLPLDTPILEYSSVLLAKAGGETEKQIYRFTKGDTDMSLRFDLTVPLAKYVAKNYHTLAFPFRRYQIGKVYRGERPQKGRFREFYQCDIDVVGDGQLSVLTDAEMPAVIYTVFKELGFENFTVHIANRKIIKGYLQEAGLTDKTAEISVVLDKIKKIGAEKVAAELAVLGLSQAQIKPLLQLTALTGADFARFSCVDETFKTGVAELQTVIDGMKRFGVPEKNFTVDLSIVRGLDYYTGTVYETFLAGHENIGSVCSGGRYDNLAGYYTDKPLPGVGISIGLTRLFDKLGSETSAIARAAQVLVVSADGAIEACLPVAASFRAAGISASAYLEDAKLKNKFKYADRLGIPFMAIIGETERKNGTVTLKNLASGEQFEGITENQAAIKIKDAP